MWRKLLCFIGIHQWMWRHEEGDELSLYGLPPDRARCYFCGERFKKINED